VLLSDDTSAQLFQESIQERSSRRQTYDEFLVGEIRRLPEVKQREERINRESNFKHLSLFVVESEGKGIYVVSMLEDKGTNNQVLHYRYTVDSASGRILKTEEK
jgi:hypothetical protein